MRLKLRLIEITKLKSIACALAFVGGGLIATNAHAQTGIGAGPSLGVAMPSIASMVTTTMAMSGHQLPNRAPGFNSAAPTISVPAPMASAPASGTAMEQFSLNSMRAAGDNIGQQMAATAAMQQAQLAGNIGINAGYANQMNQLSANAAFTQSALAAQYSQASLQEVISSAQAQSTARAAGIRAGVAAGGTAFSNGTGFFPAGIGPAWSPFGGMGLGMGGGMSAFNGGYQSIAYGPFGGRLPTFANFGMGLNGMSGLPGYGFSPGFGSAFAVGDIAAIPAANMAASASNPWGRPAPAICNGTESECGARSLADLRADAQFAQFRYFMEGPANNIQFLNGRFGVKYGNIRIQAPGTFDNGSTDAMNGYNHVWAAANNMFSNRMLPKYTTINLMAAGSNLYNAPGINFPSPADGMRAAGLFQGATNTVALRQTGADHHIYHELGHAAEHQIVDPSPFLAAQAAIANHATQLNPAYNHSHDHGSSYAQKNRKEGFAENTAAYFNQHSGGGTYYRGSVVTAQDLQAQNPAAYGLMRQVYGK